MVEALVDAGPLDCLDITRLGDDANRLALAARIGADGAELPFGEIMAARTEVNCLLDVDDCLGDAKCDFVITGQEPVENTLRGFGPDARGMRSISSSACWIDASFFMNV